MNVGSLEVIDIIELCRIMNLRVWLFINYTSDGFEVMFTLFMNFYIQ